MFYVGSPLVSSPRVYIKVISNGNWNVVGTQWTYEGNPKVKGLLIKEDVNFSVLKTKLFKNIDIDKDKQVAEIKYVCPDKGDGPPISINDDDDLRAFKFLNATRGCCVWDIDLYTSLVGQNLSDVVAGEETHRGVIVDSDTSDTLETTYDTSDTSEDFGLETDLYEDRIAKIRSYFCRRTEAVLVLPAVGSSHAEGKKRKSEHHIKDIITLSSDEEDLHTRTREKEPQIHHNKVKRQK